MNNTIKKHDIFLRRVVALALSFLLCVNTAIFADVDVSDQTLAAQLRTDILQFRDDFEKKYFLLAHDAVNEYIRNAVAADANGDFSKMPRYDDKVSTSSGKTIDITVIPIKDLFKNTAQFAHVGFGSLNEGQKPVVYIDSKFYYDEKLLSEAKQIILMHETAEIAKWAVKAQELNIPLGKLRKRWVRRNIEQAKSAMGQYHSQADQANDIERLFSQYSYMIDWETVYYAYERHGLNEEDQGDINVAAGGFLKQLLSLMGEKYIDIDEAEFISIMRDLKSMDRMFEAYESILSEYGRKTAEEVDVIYKALEEQKRSGKIKSRSIERAKALISLMPDPRHIDVKTGGDKNWLNWFINDPLWTDPWGGQIGRGCLHSCYFCRFYNKGAKTNSDPLPVVVNRILNKSIYSVGVFFHPWANNDLLDWYDPFFGVGLDGITELALRNNEKAEVDILTRGWDSRDAFMQKSAEGLVQVCSGGEHNFGLSFHLFGQRHGIVNKLHKDLQLNELEGIIESCSVWYEDVLRTLSPVLKEIRINIPMRYDPMYKAITDATNETFIRAWERAGLPQEDMVMFRFYLKRFEGPDRGISNDEHCYLEKSGIRLIYRTITAEGSGSELIDRFNGNPVDNEAEDDARTKEYKERLRKIPYIHNEIDIAGNVKVLSRNGDLLYKVEKNDPGLRLNVLYPDRRSVGKINSTEKEGTGITDMVRKRSYDLGDLKDLYVRIYSDDICLARFEIIRLLGRMLNNPVPLAADVPEPCTKEHIEYIWDVYTNSRDYSIYPCKGSTWYGAHIDVFEVWKSLGKLSENDFRGLTDYISKLDKKNRFEKKERFNEKRDSHVNVRTMLEKERDFGRLLLKLDYHPPVSRIIEFCDLELWEPSEGGVSIRSLSGRIEDVAKKESDRISLYAHRIGTPAIFLNMILEGGLKEGYFSSFTGEMGYGPYVVAEITDKDNGRKRLLYIVPDDRSRQITLNALKAAEELGIISEKYREYMEQVLFTYDAFHQKLSENVLFFEDLPDLALSAPGSEENAEIIDMKDYIEARRSSGDMYGDSGSTGIFDRINLEYLRSDVIWTNFGWFDRLAGPDGKSDAVDALLSTQQTNCIAGIRSEPKVGELKALVRDEKCEFCLTKLDVGGIRPLDCWMLVKGPKEAVKLPIAFDKAEFCLHSHSHTFVREERPDKIDTYMFPSDGDISERELNNIKIMEFVLTDAGICAYGAACEKPFLISWDELENAQDLSISGLEEYCAEEFRKAEGKIDLSSLEEGKNYPLNWGKVPVKEELVSFREEINAMQRDVSVSDMPEILLFYRPSLGQWFVRIGESGHEVSFPEEIAAEEQGQEGTAVYIHLHTSNDTKISQSDRDLAIKYPTARWFIMMTHEALEDDLLPIEYRPEYDGFYEYDGRNKFGEIGDNISWSGFSDHLKSTSFSEERVSHQAAADMFLDILKNNDDLMKAALGDEGFSVNELADKSGNAMYRGILYDGAALLRAAGIICPGGNGHDMYIFSPMMLNRDRDEAHTKTLINAIRDIRLPDGKSVYFKNWNEENWELENNEQNDKWLSTAKELVRMTVLDEDLKRQDIDARGKTMWHVIEADVLSSSQERFIPRINKTFRDPKYIEKVRIINKNETVSGVISSILREDPEAVVDVMLACSENVYDPVFEEHPEIKMLVFDGSKGDFTQLEGIIMALRALHLDLSSEMIIKELLHIYEGIMGAVPDLNNRSVEELKDMLKDPREFARWFKYQSLTRMPIQEMTDMNERMIRFLAAA